MPSDIPLEHKKAFTVFRSAAEEAEMKRDEQSWDNEGGHMSSTAGRVTHAPRAVLPYVVVLQHQGGEPTERAFATMREAEAFMTGGAIRGKTLADGSEIFRAIPFAAPVGNLRWKPPAPVPPWKGIRNAFEDSRPCMQLSEGWNAADAASGSEDCLYLALHTPGLKVRTPFPVYVWIRGGSNRAGSGFGVVESPLYKRGIVVIEVEYRLGVFGFLASPELSRESPRRSSGNYALLDLIAALHWVRDNVAHFGGDPENVTIGGQSAGGVDVGQLMRSPLARGLFKRAIEESGAPGLPRTKVQNEDIGRNFMSLLQLPATAEGLATLRSLPAKQLLDAGTKLVGPDGQFDALWIASSADNWVLPGRANDIRSYANQTQVPLLIGNLTREFPVPTEAARAVIENMFGANTAQALVLYGFKDGTPPPDDPVLGGAGTQVVTDLAFRCSANQISAWENPNRVWRYQLGVPAPGMDHPRGPHCRRTRQSFERCEARSRVVPCRFIPLNRAQGQHEGPASSPGADPSCLSLAKQRS